MSINIWEIVRFCTVLAITFVITKITSKAFNSAKTKDTLHIKFISNFLVVAEWTIGLAIALYSFDSFQHIAGTLLAGSGILAIVLGLAAQESFSNLFSGIFLCLFKPFNIDDRISIDSDGTYGVVEDITLRHTVIRTYTNVRVIIPNSVIAKARIENSTYSDGAAYPIELEVAYGSKEKLDRAMEIMEEVVTNHPLFYKDKAATVKTLCTGFNSSGIGLKVMMWTKNVSDNITACSECRVKIAKRFIDENIEIPFTQVDLHIKENENK